MRFSASTLMPRITIVWSPKSHLFYSFLLETPQKHTLCVNFIISIKSVIIRNPSSVFVPSLEIPLSSLDFLWTYSQKITFYDISCIKCPQNSHITHALRPLRILISITQSIFVPSFTLFTESAQFGQIPELAAPLSNYFLKILVIKRRHSFLRECDGCRGQYHLFKVSEKFDEV